MKKLFLTTALLALFANFSIAQDRIPTADFTRIEVRNAFRVLLIPSDKNEVVFPENFEFPVVQPSMFSGHTTLTPTDLVSVRGNTLTIGYSETHQNLWHRRANKNTRRVGEQEIVIYFKSLESLSLSGATSARSDNPIVSNSFRLSLSGASNARLELIAERLALSLSGASNARLELVTDRLTTGMSGSSRATLSGGANEHRLSASGSSRADLENLKTRQTNVSISGSSSARILTQTLTGGASGSSSVRGIWSENNVKTSGSSSVRHQ
jgi:hypothetical protein